MQSQPAASYQLLQWRYMLCHLTETFHHRLSPFSQVSVLSREWNGPVIVTFYGERSNKLRRGRRVPLFPVSVFITLTKTPCPREENPFFRSCYFSYQILFCWLHLVLLLVLRLQWTHCCRLMHKRYWHSKQKPIWETTSSFHKTKACIFVNGKELYVTNKKWCE